MEQSTTDKFIAGGSSDGTLWMEAMARQMPAIMWTADRQLQLQSITGGRLANLELKPEQLIGLSLAEFFQSGDAQSPPIVAHQRALCGERAGFEQAWGSVRFQVQVDALRDQENRIVGCLGVAVEIAAGLKPEMVCDITDRRQVEEKLRASEQQHRLLVESMRDGLGIADENHVMTYVNDRCCEMFGCERDELLGRPVVDLAFDKDKQLLLRILARLRHGENPRFEFCWKRKDGRPITTITSPQPMFDAQGRFQGSFAVLTDISDQKRIQESLRISETKFRKLAETIPAMVAIYQGLSHRYVNPAAEVLTGYSRDELLALSAVDIVHNDYRQLVQRLNMARQQGEMVPSRYEYKIVTKTRERRWVEFSAAEIDYEGQPALLGIAYDITERKRVEEALRAERRLLRKLLDLQDRERRLLACEIHDGFVQDVVGAKLLVESVCGEMLDSQRSMPDELETVRSLLHRAINEGRHMISQLRPMVIDEMGIVEAINYLVGEEEASGKMSICFRHDVHFKRLPPLLEGTIYRIVQESLANAKRHSKSTEAEIHLLQVGHELRLEIIDAGIGFDVAQVPEDRFGLRGIRERARLFGGQAEIRSSPGQGTCVSVVLPMKLPDEVVEEYLARSTASRKRQKSKRNGVHS
jgi:PAS domain S-box-containing protein